MCKISAAELKDSKALSLLIEELMSQEADFVGNREVHQKGIDTIISNSELGLILKLEVKGEIVGMINILFSISTAIGEKVAIFEDFIISKSHRGKGYGKQLFGAAIAEAEIQGCKRISLLTDSDNKIAQSFYKNQGLEPSEMVPFRKMI